MKRNVSVVHLIVATRSSGPPASGKIIKEMPGSVANGTSCSIPYTQRRVEIYIWDLTNHSLLNKYSILKIKTLWVTKGKVIPVQAWTGPEGSSRLRLPDFKTIGI
jgi:hypothetical protein